MQDAVFFYCGENLNTKGVTYLTNSLFDSRSPENNGVRAEFILDANLHKVSVHFHFSFKKKLNHVDISQCILQAMAEQFSERVVYVGASLLYSQTPQFSLSFIH